MICTCYHRTIVYPSGNKLWTTAHFKSPSRCVCEPITGSCLTY